MDDRKILLIDGYNFAFRAYHALPPLSTKDGTPVGAIYGFIAMIFKLIENLHPTHIAMVFDSGKSSFRKDLYPEYKANRPPPPEDLIIQFPIFREAAKAFNMQVFEEIGFEADDIIATIAKKAVEQNEQVIIISTDKDLMQLIDDVNVIMYDPVKTKSITSAEVMEKFGVKPDKLLDALALIGDSSDNVPGAPGIGPKTAAGLIHEFGSLENLLSNLDKVPQAKRRESLLANKESVELSKQLISLKTDMDINLDFNELKVDRTNPNNLLEFLQKYEFKNLATKAKTVYNINHTPVENKKADVIEIKSKNDIEQLKIEAENSGKMSFYFDENNNLYLFAGQHIFVAHNMFPQEKQASLFSNHSGVTLNDFKELFKNKYILKLAFDLKKFMRANQVDIDPFDDIMLMAYIDSEGMYEHNLANIFEFYAAEHTLENPHDIVTGLFKLHNILLQTLSSKKLLNLYYMIEKPLVKILLDMEMTGVRIDPNELFALSKIYTQELKILEAEIFILAKCEFNIASPKQVGEVIFGNLGLSAGKNKSTSVDILEELALEGHEIADKIIKWRGISKLKNTYSDALVKQIHPKDGRVHSHFQMAVTLTGRLSSTNPNLQNIPIRTEEGNKIRKAFTATPGFKLVSADYSQIELRILAHIADIPSLKNAFKMGKDIHVTTAAEIFGVPENEVDSHLRRRAKAINFGIIYGISAFGLAKQLGISRKEAGIYIERYFKEYPGIEAYMEVTKEKAKAQGYVTTIFNRRCHIKQIASSNFAIRNFAERSAINAPMQGSAADIIKMAMIEVEKLIVKQKFNAKMILQVHDELLFEVKEEETENFKQLVKRNMENITTLSVPLIVDASSGNNWADL